MRRRADMDIGNHRDGTHERAARDHVEHVSLPSRWRPSHQMKLLEATTPSRVTPDEEENSPAPAFPHHCPAVVGAAAAAAAVPPAELDVDSARGKHITPNSLRESGAHAVMFSYEIPSRSLVSADLSKPDETEPCAPALIVTKPDHSASSNVWQDHHISSQPNFGFPVAKFPIRLSSAYQMYSSFRSALPKDDGPSFDMCSKCTEYRGSEGRSDSMLRNLAV
ncbi:hypothetical protein NEUTE1DRAFT_51197 [Neurospora tetrasperma FGSC 2508]|uniref:Uncharacterized protein n=1 Tax=Neurospora tetrasperma (strain FGSC 2508 / ATCC MYA-4615 / P0657) TaxID=510951 RepID=F8N399_NEUT8|nr:uncharacterized protein NEUTE1DRAFT_51197 [Neurospora tetrasperma FGSC 2508]EGO53406.1 hypothetical protein NEUTE1DRAFT_51197 [Neurospora tetrasperma FGSC 2508]EGZ76440.1 hypothetical protein NEUTE2DRAFT_123085 [Neurospora tetrasperma FGSC 2509]